MRKFLVLGLAVVIASCAPAGAAKIAATDKIDDSARAQLKSSMPDDAQSGNKRDNSVDAYSRHGRGLMARTHIMH
ncbi:MAG: hypothetical protein D6719_03430 [Candidatus Dadabacteria bacterium]|nr:MAG: hypothetical protein D6719_03430 [Candidatus Dadabacteria bacterium]